jgi:S1-C subfamily serine protease
VITQLAAAVLIVAKSVTLLSGTRMAGWILAEARRLRVRPTSFKRGLIIGSRFTAMALPCSAFIAASPSACLHAQDLPRVLTPLSDTLVHKLVKEKTCWIRCPMGNDRVSTGTGVLIDATNYYILTAYHVTDGASKIMCFFSSPEAGDDANDPNYYLRRSDQLAIRGKIVAADASKDLSLIKLLPSDEQIGLIPRYPVALATYDLEEGQHILTVGNSGASKGVLWRFSGGAVRQLYKKAIRYDEQNVNARVMEVQLDINPGDSGGPVASSYGVLVGINSGSDPKQTDVPHICP